MILFHGSRVSGITTLEPRIADHNHPYIYFSTLEAVAALYLCNTVEKPYYWFPYGFEKDDMSVPIYHELYSDALRHASEGVSGYIYKVDVEEHDPNIVPFINIPCARLATKPITVVDCMEITDVYDLLQKYIKAGQLKVATYEDKSKSELEGWYDMVISTLTEKELFKKPNCSYANFIKEKLPLVWERYINSI